MEELIQAIDEKTQDHQSESLTSWTLLKEKFRQFLGLMDAVVIEIQKDADQEQELRARAAKEKQSQHTEQHQNLQEG